jgi:hypothetical protein
MTFPARWMKLPEGQRVIVKDLEPITNRSFVLYGGTAVTLRFGHRTSVDFDFFATDDLDKTWVNTLPLMSMSTVIQDAPNTLVALVSSSSGPVKISFFGGVRTGRVSRPEMTEHGELMVASAKDLFAHKLKTILQRAEAKDYADIAELLRQGYALAEALGAARALFPHFEPAECLKALCFFDDGDLTALPDRDRAALIAAAKSVRKIPLVPIVSSRLEDDAREFTRS